MNFGTLKDDPSLRGQLNAEEGVYVISNDGETFKVGMVLKEYEQSSRSIYRRMQNFQTCFPRGFKIYNVIITDDPRAAERQMHKTLIELGAKRVRFQALTSQRDSEWFETDTATIEKAIRRVAQTPGFYAKRIIRLTSRGFQDLAKPSDTPPATRSTVSCREVGTKRFEDYVLARPVRQQQQLRARIQAKCA